MAYLAHLCRLCVLALLISITALHGYSVQAQDTNAPKTTESAADDAAIRTAKETKARRAKNQRVIDEVVKAVKERFYNRDNDYNGVDLDKWRDEWRAKVADAANTTELHKLVRDGLKAFKASHFTIMRGDIYIRNFKPEMDNTTSQQFGMDLMESGGKLFIEDACWGGAARRAGLKRGDEIVTLNGVPVFESTYLVDGGSDPLYATHYCVIPPIKGGLTVGIRRTKDGPVESVELAPSAFSMINATRESVQVIERDGKKYGYFRIYHFLHAEIANIAADAIGDKFKDCDGLLIDLRGRGGQAPLVEEILGMVGGKGQAGLQGMMGRFMRGGGAGRSRDVKFTKPVVCMIDSSSRSAKEIFAHNFRIDTKGKLVGQPTAGAVIAGSFQALSDGSYLLVPVSAAQDYSRDRAVLEANPVKPDITIELAAEYAGGRDDLLEGGLKQITLEVAAAQAKGEKKTAEAAKEEPKADEATPSDTDSTPESGK